MGVLRADDIEAAHRAAVHAGATSLMAPEAYPGGTYAVLSDPQAPRSGSRRAHER